jgi:hypothetical protein
MVQLLIIILIIFIVIFSILFYCLRKYLTDREKYSIFLTGRNKKKIKIFNLLYDFFSQWRITKRYIKKITRQFEIQMPGDHKKIEDLTMKLALFIWFMDFLLIILLFVRSPSCFNAVLTIIYLVISNNQVFYTTVESSEIKLLKQFDKLLGDIRHYYQAHGMIEEAIYDSIEKAAYPIKLHAAKIHEILEAEDVEEETNKYNESVPNRFLKTFLALCVMMIKFGDKEIEKQSLLLINMKYLKQEVYTEVLKREKMKHLFSGLIFVSVTPVLFLKAIENWAETSLPEMVSYYKGPFGIITMVSIFLITLISYTLIIHLKENSTLEIKKYILIEHLVSIPFLSTILNNIINRYYGRIQKIQDLIKKTGEAITPKQFLMKRLIFSVFTLIGCLIISITIHISSKDQVLHNYNNLDYLNSAVSDSQIEMMVESIATNLQRFKNDTTITIEDLIDILSKEGIIKNKQLLTMTAKEIISRIHSYQKEYFRWYELIIIILAAVAAYYAPYLNLLFLKKLRQMHMEDEVIQFHSIILMLMHIDRMTIETILVWMENFAVTFKASLQECINDLQSGEMEVLDELKLKEPYEPFVKIIENLQMCDKIGIEKAFDEIAVERVNYQEKRKLENEIYINDKSIIGKVIAFTPLFITIGLYLIIPFIVEGLTLYAGYIGQMQGV